MYIKNWKKEIFSVPNLLSMFRLVLIPVYLNIYLHATEPVHYYKAGAILALSCLTDMVDGKIARRYNMITNVGKLLDPLADKLTQLALTVCLSTHFPVLVPVLVLFLIKEFFQLFALIINLRKGKALDGALVSGKICTTVLFLTLITLVLFPDLDPEIVNMLAIMDALCLTVAFVQYHLAFFGKNAKLHDLEA